MICAYCIVSGGLQWLADLQRTPWLQHSMPWRASGRHCQCILASSPKAFSRPVLSALAAAHTYRRICHVPCAVSEKSSWLAQACQPLCCSTQSWWISLDYHRDDVKLA